MKIVAIADIHGQLPDPAECPRCDLVLIGGDVCPDLLPQHQIQWLDYEFRGWLNALPFEHEVVGIAGNHDSAFESHHDEIEGLSLPWVYLLNNWVMVDGLKIYGIPFIPVLASWPFYADDYTLAQMYEEIPMDTDIILSHGPPLGIGDLTVPRHGSFHVGNLSALEAIDRIKPKAFVCGHIHEGRGLYHRKDTSIYNVAAVNDRYEPHSDPFIEIDV